MFYSHEILTSRKYGVATIWLMATLGTQSGCKKITRKAILDVNLPKACETVTEPGVPLALRLQASLLVGISRVFGQQCEYMVQDTDSLRVRMRKIVRVQDTQQINPHLQMNRPDQLNLPEDPVFDIDVDVGLDLSIFDISTSLSRRTIHLSADGEGTTQPSLQFPDQPFSLQTSSPPSLRDPLYAIDPSFIQIRPEGADSSDGSNMVSGLILDEPAVYDNHNMHVDDEGQLIFASDPANSPVLFSEKQGELEISDAVEPLESDLPKPNVQEYEAVVGILDADSMMQHQDSDPRDDLDNGDGSERNHPINVSTSINELHATKTAGAPQSQARTSKPPRPDLHTQLNKGQLNIWASKYLQNMDGSRLNKTFTKSAKHARGNATFWILEQGIGGVKVNFGSDIVPHPLSFFSGHNLLTALQGHVHTKKRPRSDSDSHYGDNDDDQHRRQRVKSLGSEQERLEGEVFQDLAPLQDDWQPESEVGRKAESSLKDHSSQMPWNLSSRQGSLRPYGSAFHRVSSVAGSVAGFEVGPPSTNLGRRSRLTSASPLIGKGRPFSPDGTPEHGSRSQFDYAIDDFDDLDQNLAGVFDEDFELYGPAAAVSTQQAVQSQWLATTLEKEGRNFLDYLTTTIQNQAADATEAERDTIYFHTLIAPDQNSPIVAAQALLHVLTLATKELIAIHQEKGFGDITLKLNLP